MTEPADPSNEADGTVHLDAAPANDRRSSPRRPVVALTIVAALALLAAGLFLRPGSGDVEVAIDEDDPTPSTVPDAPAPDIESMPTPIALAAPDDGKESVGLPVAAEPGTGLTDGQVVSVTGMQFPPNQQVGVVMCTREAGQDDGARGVDACNIGHVGQGTTDSQGNVTVDFGVRRFVVFDGQEIDCASEPGRCIIGMGLLSDYDQSGGVAVDFDPDVPPPAPPTAELSRSEGLRDGETVELSLTGLVPNSSLYLQQCTEGGACAPSFDDARRVDAEGSFTGPFRLWRQFGSYGFEGQPANVDCAVDACHLEIQGETTMSRQFDVIPLTFDPASGTRSAPTVALLDEGPHAVGSTFSVEVRGIRRGDYVEAAICPVPGRECVAYGDPAGPSDGDRVTIDVVVARADPICAEACPLTVSVHPGSGGPSSGPPPLVPEPVDVTITG